MFKQLIFILVLQVFMLPNKISAQNGQIFGEVKDWKSSEPLIGASIVIKGAGVGTTTDKLGKYVLHNLQNGVYHLQISFIGYRPSEHEVEITKNQPLKVDILLKEDVNQLDALEITAETKEEQLKQSTKQITIIAAKNYHDQSVNTGTLIGKEAGISVRQDGGLGSSANFSINGISGKQIKFFIDEIPLELFGSGMSLPMLPVNLIERIEIYKGTVPVQLGADALGGAINVVTPKKAINSLDVHYSHGSFNTHEVVAMGKVFLNRNIFVDAKGFYNYSDNNYEIDVTVPNQYGEPQDTTVKRFHDKFNNYLVGIGLGYVNSGLTKHVSLHITHSGLNDQIQHNALMSQPYGQATYAEKSWNGMLRIENKALLNGLNLNLCGGINFIEGLFVDTTLNVYTWDGKVFTKKSTGGEISSSMNHLTLNNRSFLGKINLNYSFSENSSLDLNVFTSTYQRKGKDPVAEKFYGQDYYAHPVTMDKIVTGLSWNKSYFKDFVTSTTFAKHFLYYSKGYTLKFRDFIELPLTKKAQLGAGQLLKFKFSKYWHVKTSYEYASRLPDVEEVLGDLILVKPNAELIPETSHNFNLGTYLTLGNFNFELNGFYRRVKDIIFLKTTQFYAQYLNLLAAEIKGVEGELKFNSFSNLQLRLNATFQDVRNKSSKEESNVVSDKYYNARIPNTPVFFSNLEIRHQIKDFLKEGNTFSWWWDASYVDDFYLHWEVDGLKSSKFTIPSQLIQNAGFSYKFGQQITISTGCANLLNQKAYDNFNVQKPGRSHYVKAKFHFKKIRHSKIYNTESTCLKDLDLISRP